MIDLPNSKPIRRIRIIVPVFNDWDSLGILLRELEPVGAALDVRMAVTVVDDGSTIPLQTGQFQTPVAEHIDEIEIIHLSTNLGHQRAIAVGLCAAVEKNDCDAVVVMDADGEDSPQAIAQLIQAAGQDSDFCVVARRGKRSERFTFKFSYLMYKLLFKLLTGKQIDFGNFCLLSIAYARRLVNISELWNNLPAAVLRSRLPIKQVPVDRAHRYAGESRMNLTSLVVHGLSGISVYAETIFVRFLFLSLALFILSVLSVAVVLTLRIFFPLYATPGWASTVSFGVTILLVQALSFTLSSILMLLNGRVQRVVIPFADYKIFIESRQVLHAAVHHEA